MIAWWTFDATTSVATSPDNLGRHPADVIGSTDVPGKVFGAASFIGGGSRMRVPDQIVTSADRDQLDFGTGDFSIVFWIKTTQTTTGTVLSKRTDIAIGYGVDIWNDYLRLWLKVDDSHGVIASMNVTVSDNLWHLVAITVQRSSTQGLRFYKDGVQTTVYDATPAIGSLTTDEDLFLGMWGDEGAGGTGFFFLQGRLDELQLFARALTATEVRRIYTAGSLGTCTCRNC